MMAMLVILGLLLSGCSESFWGSRIGNLEETVTTLVSDFQDYQRSQAFPGGYFFDEKGFQTDGKVVDEVCDKVKISYRVLTWHGYDDAKKWIPKSEFHKYYDLKELSREVNEMKGNIKSDNQ
jgi:hypothetical protein